jgi:type II secretory pathway pseudopilin PulG
MIELLIVITIAGIIATFAIPPFNNAQQNRMAQNARDSFVWLGNKAKSRAIEMGTTWMLEVDPATEKAWIVKRNPTVASDTLQIVDYPTQYASTISTRTNTLVRICYNSRGYAWPCTGGLGATEVITFTHALRTSRVSVMTLGQMQRL